MNWTTFDRDYVLAALPLARKPYIVLWIGTVTGFAAKIDETIANVIADFRLALAQAGNTLHADPEKLPDTCLRYAHQVVEYEISRLVDGYLIDAVPYSWPLALSGLIRAEVYQRAIVETKMKLEAANPTGPTYNPPTVTARALPLDTE